MSKDFIIMDYQKMSCSRHIIESNLLMFFLFHLIFRYVKYHSFFFFFMRIIVIGKLKKVIE